MLSRFVLALLAGGVLSPLALPAEAGERDGTKVKGYAERRGGYSYGYADSVNTYGDGRTNFGGASAYRDPNLDRQTTAGPFDHGFFFDSGVIRNGGDSPYMN